MINLKKGMVVLLKDELPWFSNIIGVIEKISIYQHPVAYYVKILSYKRHGLSDMSGVEIITSDEIDFIFDEIKWAWENYYEQIEKEIKTKIP